MLEATPSEKIEQIKSRRDRLLRERMELQTKIENLSAEPKDSPGSLSRLPPR